MTHYLAELYSPKATWIALSKEEKQAFFATIGAGMGSLSEFGIEPLACGQTDPSCIRLSAFR